MKDPKGQNFKIPAYFSLISAQTQPEHDHARHEALKQKIRHFDLEPVEVVGHYGVPERALLVPHRGTVRDRRLIETLGKEFGQQSVLHNSGLRNDLVYLNEDKTETGYGLTGGGDLKDYYVELPGGTKLRLHTDNAKHFHANAYPWHDPEHKVAIKKSEDSKFPHSEAHGPAPKDDEIVHENDEIVHENDEIVHENDQAGGNHSGLFHEIMGRYGKINEGQKTKLDFYRGLERHEGKIDQHIANDGYKVYYAGGKFGKPDLQNRNYATKHLMVYDPTPGSGGDFSDEAFTRSWRKLHEKAHADTYAQVNQEFGEGRRLGKLGNRTLREMKRSVRWEDLAVARQRHLAAQMGHHISDEDYNRERNVVIGDAVHRATTGSFTDPGEMGFVPSEHHIPISGAYSYLEQHAKKLGLRHENDTLQQLHQDRMKLKKKLTEVRESLRKKEELIKSTQLVDQHDPACSDCGSAEIVCACYQGLSTPDINTKAGNIKVLFKSDWSEQLRDSYMQQFKERGRALLAKHFFGANRG